MAPSAALAARNALGATLRHHRDDPERVADARRRLAAAKLEGYIARTVADAPPLTPEQRDRLAALLRPTAGGGRVA